MKHAIWALILVLAVGCPAPAGSHPHATIDLRSKVVFDDAGRVVALKLDWLFDEFYSAYAMETVPTDAAGRDKGLAELTRRNLASLDEYKYFSDLRLDGVPVDIKPATDGRSAWDGRRLSMSFTVPLAAPIDPRAGRFTFSVYDPTYYIEVLYLKGDPIALMNGAKTGCAARVLPPNPSSEARGLAGTLGKDETATATLGKLFSPDPSTSFGALFAETAVIECRR